MIKNEKSLVGVMRGQGSMTATVSMDKSLVGELNKPKTAASYNGAYEVTPSSESQTIHCGGYNMGQDITIAPIPSNYGLITFNGATITVS